MFLDLPLKEILKRAPLTRQLLQLRYLRLFKTTGGKARMFYGVYPSWEKAESSAPATKGIGYNFDSCNQLFAAEHISEGDYPAIFWLSKLLEKGVRRIFDWGGYHGVQFYSYKPLLGGYPPDLLWQICDVEAIVNAGIRLAETRGESQLCFTTNYQDADGADLLISTGALQHINIELSQLLSEVNKKPAYILINNIPVTEGNAYYTLVNIGPCFCAYRILSRPELLSKLKILGYEVVDSWEVFGKGLDIPFYPERNLDHYSGLFLKRVTL